MEKISCIYKITNIQNSKFYIGSAINYIQRIRVHKSELRKCTHHSIYLQNAWNKYGEENFKFEILEIVEDIKEILKREQYYLDKLKPNYNISRFAGSTIGFKHSLVSKEKMSKSQKGKTHSKYSKEKISKSNKGKKRTSEFKLRIKNMKLGLKWTEEQKIAQSIKAKIRGQSEGQKLGLIKARKTLIGKPKSEETKRKISKSNKGKISVSRIKVARLDKNSLEILEEYISFTEASIKTGVDISSIAKATKEEKRTAGNFKWRKII